jgi:O-methyltransferase
MKLSLSHAANAVRNALARARGDVDEYGLPPDFDAGFRDVFAACKPYTMTSPERMYALYQAVEYVLRAGIPGSFVECGVWRGGSAMVVATTLLRAGVSDRKIYLYDTFEGMSAPTERDEDLRGNDARALTGSCLADLDDVKTNLGSTGYPEANVVYVKGKVEETIPAVAPDAIALLRLDTDWYESTYHEFVHLYPRLQSRGVLVLDDYGHWKGAREATDRYVRECGLALLLDRVDYTGRVAIKP